MRGCSRLTCGDVLPNYRTSALHVTPQWHCGAMANVDKAIVFGINSLALQMNNPNDAIVDYTRADPD